MEFIFEDIIYKYENGWIYYKDNYGCLNKLCPVLDGLNEIISTFDTVPTIIPILEAIVHSCLYGYSDGKKAKVREFKRVFDID